MGVVEGILADEVSQLANSSGVDIILPDLLSTSNHGRLVFLVCHSALACVIGLVDFNQNVHIQC